MYKSFTAIVIDDDKDTLEVFCEYLEIIGVKAVGKGRNGKEAAELYQQKKPDVVFLDLVMPEYDGLYALENIRKIDPKAKIVIVTADLRDDDERRLDSLKPTKIFFKPFDIDQIKKLLSELEDQLVMVQPDKYKNALISFVIHDTLKQISESIVEEVGNRLYAKHNSYFSDCLEHPEYLRDILKEIFGNGYLSIIETIKVKLGEVSEQKQISDFLGVLNG
jgi:two-component system chemotaxis response regulator CheY